MRAFEGQSLIDVCIREYGTLEALFAFAEGNKLSLDATFESGQELVSIPFKADLNRFEITESVPAQTLKRAIISDGQNLLDIAVQETGSLEGLFEIAALNGLQISEELAAGQSLRRSSEIKPDLVQYFASRKHRVNTGTSAPTTSVPGEDPDGIFWVDGDGTYIEEGNDNYILA